MQKYVVRPTIKDNDNDELYEATSVVMGHFDENPDEPYATLLIDNNGELVALGRVMNPHYELLLYSVGLLLDRHKRNTAVRTVQINTK